MPNTQLTDLERDTRSGLLARDVADTIMGYLASLNMLEYRNKEMLHDSIRRRVQDQLEKRRI